MKFLFGGSCFHTTFCLAILRPEMNLNLPLGEFFGTSITKLICKYVI